VSAVTRRDVLLLGDGLANGLVAWRLQQRRPELKLQLVEPQSRLGGRHTWSFHGYAVRFSATAGLGLQDLEVARERNGA